MSQRIFSSRNRIAILHQLHGTDRREHGSTPYLTELRHHRHHTPCTPTAQGKSTTAPAQPGKKPKCRDSTFMFLSRLRPPHPHRGTGLGVRSRQTNRVHPLAINLFLRAGMKTRSDVSSALSSEVIVRLSVLRTGPSLPTQLRYRTAVR